jgi:hypothetical protein
VIRLEADQRHNPRDGKADSPRAFKLSFVLLLARLLALSDWTCRACAWSERTDQASERRMSKLEADVNGTSGPSFMYRLLYVHIATLNL